MYAIVKIAGKQFRLEEKRRVRVPLLNVESGNKVEFDNILVYNDDKNVQIGTPTVSKVKVSATVLEHNREKKIVVFKKKRRKGYQVKNGHRQDYSLIIIDKIGAGTVTKTDEPKIAQVKTPKTDKPVATAKTVEKPKVASKVKADTKAIKPQASAKILVKPKAATKAKAESKPVVKKAAAKTTVKAKTVAKAKPKAVASKKAAPKDKKE